MPTLDFKGKTAVQNHHRTVPHRVLDLAVSLSTAKKPALDGNLLIEGDNLQALKSLLPTHVGRVKAIYIDPPYNTGNEGWVYNDNLQQPQFKEWIGKTVGKEEEDSCRHDKWCCMMFPRLELLKSLLHPEGIFAVSIDDNELHSLRSMLDEIFGLEAFLGCVTWRTRNTDNRVDTNLSVDHEYVLLYSPTRAALRGRVIDRSAFDNPDGDPRGPYVTDPLTGKATREERPNLHFAIHRPASSDRYEPDPSRGWITDMAGVKKLIAEDRVWWPTDHKSGKPRKKRFLSEAAERMPVSSFWGHLKGQSGADEVDQILGERKFAFPKSIEFMTTLLDLIAAPDAIVLDATGGSGTTAHATLALNAEDDGSRRFVLIQQPYDTRENESDKVNICRSITRERIVRVAKGYKSLDGEKVKGLGGEFTFATLGDPLLTPMRTMTEPPPSYDDMAKYIWFTDTSRPFDPSLMDRASGRLGAVGKTLYYLLYAPGGKGLTTLDRTWLDSLSVKERKAPKVVYAERIRFRREDLGDERDGYGDVKALQLPNGAK